MSRTRRFPVGVWLPRSARKYDTLDHAPRLRDPKNHCPSFGFAPGRSSSGSLDASVRSAILPIDDEKTSVEVRLRHERFTKFLSEQRRRLCSNRGRLGEARYCLGGNVVRNVPLSELLLNAGCSWNEVRDYDLEGDAGYRAVGPMSAELTIFLPGSDGWIYPDDDVPSPTRDDS